MLKLTEKVKEERKKAGLAHTTAPRPTEESVERKPKRNDWMPKSIIDENVQTALALSLSEKPFHFPNESDFPGSSSKVSKMPSKLPIGHQLASDEDANDLVSQRLANIIATETEPQRSPTSATKAEKSAPIKLYSLACLTDVKDGDVVGLRTTNDYLAVVVKEEETTEVASNVELAQWMWLRDDLKKFRKSKRNTGDVVLYCSDGTLSAHSIFLEVRTPGLWQSVRRGESELDAVLIDLSTWSKDVVESLLAYVYWAEVPTVQTITESLLKLARQFSIGRLELLCENLLRVDVVKTEDEEILAANEQQDEVRDVYNENWLKSTIKPCKIVLERLRVIAESNQSEDMCHASTADEDKCSSPVKIITPGVTPISSSLSTSGFRGEEKEDIERKLDRVRSSLGKIGNNPNISGSSRRSSSRRRSVSFTVAVSPAPVAVVDLTSTEDSDDDSLLLKIPLDNLSPYIPHSTRTTSKNGYTSTPKCVAAKKERSLMTKSRWTRMGNAGVKVVKTADLTPMPNYSAMGTPELTAALNENGVRKLSKKQGKKVLKEIYEATHPVIDISNSQDDTDTEEVAPAKRPKKRIKLVGAKEESVADSGNDSDSSEGSEQSKASLMEESIMPTDVEETTDSETNEKRPSISVLINQVRKFLRKDKNLHKKVLGFEPLPLKELHAAVKAAGINCSTANLMTVLDEMVRM